MRLGESARRRLRATARWHRLDERLELRPMLALRRRARELQQLVEENTRLDQRAAEVLDELERAVAAVRDGDESAIARAKSRLGN